MIVQVTKDPLGSKGARITTEISIPSRYMVYMPYAVNPGISQRIECEKERARLRTCVESFQQEHQCGAFIARTAAECIEESILGSDMIFLLKLWDLISEKTETVGVKELIHKDLPLSIRTLRDLYKDGIEKVRIDSRETYLNLVDFAQKLVSEVVPVI